MTEPALSRRTLLIASAAAAQVESAVHYGLTAAMYGETSIQSGHIVPGIGPLGGAGEVATLSAAPAQTNAILAATGKRIRTLPLRNAGLV